MKSFVISIILAVLMGGGIVANGLYINNVGRKTEVMVEQIPDPTHPDCRPQAEALEQTWKKQAKIVHISVNHIIVDRIGEQVETLVACAECGDVYGFYTARALLLDALGDMQRLENFGAVL